jgi:hypothetical protein
MAEAVLPPIERSFCTQGEQDSKFRGAYAGTSRIPDIAVQVPNEDYDLETTLVLEIGFSQEYKSITEACRSWLEGTRTVKMCVVVVFKEVPKYNCPLDLDMDEEELNGINFPDEGEVKVGDISMAGPFGPALFKRLPEEEVDEEEEEEGKPNVVWVGNIQTAFLERWRLNGDKAVRYGKRTVSYLFLMKISLTNWYVTEPANDQNCQF